MNAVLDNIDVTAIGDKFRPVLHDYIPAEDVAVVNASVSAGTRCDNCTHVIPFRKKHARAQGFRDKNKWCLMCSECKKLKDKN